MEICRTCKINYALDHRPAILISFVLWFIYWVLNKIHENYLDSLELYGIIYFTYKAVPEEVDMSKSSPDNSKEKFLRDSGTLNTHPVADALFNDSDFFDPRDLVQVKYEMLRKVHKENEPVSNVAASFGFSRPSFYKALADFEREGITGLLPQKRGPRGGHKLTEDVLEYIKEIGTVDNPLTTSALLDEVEKRFGIRVHRRSLERAQKRYEKKTPQITGKKEGKLL